jgi:hypothetical protein
MTPGEPYNLRSTGDASFTKGLDVGKSKEVAPKWRDPNDRIWCQFVIQPGNRRCMRMFYPPPFWSTACHQHRDKVDRLWRWTATHGYGGGQEGFGHWHTVVVLKDWKLSTLLRHDQLWRKMICWRHSVLGRHEFLWRLSLGKIDGQQRRQCKGTKILHIKRFHDQ